MRRLAWTIALPLSIALGALGAEAPFPQAEGDLRADPAARYGALPNGLRYVVLANHEPRNRASLRLLVLAGSFEETDSQRGLAHLLEHMAFEGSAHYTSAALAERLQRLGMGGGADTNAATSFDHTLYRLELPDAAPASLAEGLRILADFGGGLLIEPAALARERRAIVGELRTRDSADYRTLAARLELVEAGTRVPERLPIGSESVIEKCGREALADFYNTWYRPDLMAVVAVGDFDGAAVEKQIADGFSRLAPRSGPPPAVDLGHVADFKGVKTLFHAEPDAPDTRVMIACAVPLGRQPDTAARRTAELKRRIAIEMLNRRLAGLSKRANAPFTSASADVRESFNLYREAAIEAVCKADQWTAALGAVDQELRRALGFGFRPEEFADAIGSVRGELEKAAMAAPTRRSEDVAGQIADSLVLRRVFTSPADDLALLGPELAKLTVRDCVMALQSAWTSPGRYVFVAGNAKIEGDGNSAVAFAYSKSLGVTVTPPGLDVGLAWAYSDFGPAGTVASRKHVDDLDLTEVAFANGVRLNLKKTDFEDNTVYVAARLGTGQLTEPAATQPGLSAFSGLTFTAGGLGRHGAVDLKRILAGRNVDVRFASTLDAFVLSGQTDRANIALEFQLLAASITDPGYRPEAQRDARARIESEYARFEQSVRGPLALQVPRLLFGGDPRFGLPPKDVMLARTLDEEKAWLGPQLAHGSLEVSVAGDFDIDAAIEAAARTIGALPKRDPRPPLDDLRKASFPSQPFSRDFSVATDAPKSLVAVYWPTADGMDARRAKRLVVLANLLSERVRAKARDQLGEAISPSVASSASDTFPGYGYMVAITEVDPPKAKKIQDLIISVAGDLGANGATQDELDKVKNPLLTSVLETERTNRYWMTVLGKAQEMPQVLDWARTRHADFESITKGEIESLAKDYLSPDRASRVIVHPTALQAPPKVVIPPPDA